MSGAIQKQTRKHGVSTSSRKQPTRSENTDLKISQLSTSQATETSTLLKDRNFNKELRKGGSCGTATNVSIRNCNGKLRFLDDMLALIMAIKPRFTTDI